MDSIRINFSLLMEGSNDPTYDAKFRMFIQVLKIAIIISDPAWLHACDYISRQCHRNHQAYFMSYFLLDMQIYLVEH